MRSTRRLAIRCQRSQFDRSFTTLIGDLRSLGLELFDPLADSVNREIGRMIGGC